MAHVRPIASSSLLRPGQTCWRYEHAYRLALLLDNEQYFLAVKNSMERAVRSVFILGWQFDPRTTLVPGLATNAPERQLGAFLQRLAARKPDLDIRILVWDASLPIAMTSSFYPQRAQRWFSDNIRFILDDRHPLGACHHSKLVVVDDRVAFCSGSDFAVNRWDSSEHWNKDQRRLLPSGKPYRARHAVSLVMDGAAAAAVGSLCSARWQRAGGEARTYPDVPSADPWPPNTPPDFTDVRVAIARTQPSYLQEPSIREVEALHVESIAAARRLIYLENQYFASPAIATALRARLSQIDGPEVLIVCSRDSPHFFDRMTMDAPRDALVTQLRAHDRFKRLGVYFPVTLDGSRAIVVHSKVTIIDDVLLRVGSANLNNRSLGLDTECDVAVESSRTGDDDAARNNTTIEKIFLRLLGHHLGIGCEQVAMAIENAGSVHAAIDLLQDSTGARLRRLECREPRLGRLLVAKYHLGDPESSADTWRPWRRQKTRLRFGR